MATIAPSRPARLTLAAVAFVALADTAVVALALPPILRELGTTVAGLAAVLGVYAVVLAAAIIPAERLAGAYGVRILGLWGAALFGLGSLVCGLAQGIGLLLAARAVQALGGAALLVTAHAALVHTTGARAAGLQTWRLAALLGIAAGPAIGGALTQGFGWRSIFLLQAPLTLAAVPACLQVPTITESRARRWSAGDAIPLAALTLVSGAIAAALFLTVLLLVSGWGIEPFAAALVVSIMPFTALAATRLPGSAATRAAVGAVMVSAGAAALAFLPTASVLWTVAPQVVLGIGLGLALPAIGGELLPDRDTRESARLLTARHAGIALALLILAPIAQHELNTTLDQTRLEGVALILDAPIDPQLKLDIAPRLSDAVQTEDPRGGLDEVFADARADVDDDQLSAYDTLAARADDVLVAGVDDGFRTAFLVAAGLALAAALLLALSAAPSAAGAAAAWAAPSAAGAAAVGAAVGVLAFALIASSARPDPVVIADPCQDRELPHTGGVAGLAQDAALRAVDVVACRLGSSREELVLALADDRAAGEFEKRHNVDPRSALDVARHLLPD